MRCTHIQDDGRAAQRVVAIRRECEAVRTCRVSPWMKCLGLLAVLILAGCGEDVYDFSGGSGGEGRGASAVIEVDPVYLEPGVTSAKLEWADSVGVVDNYLVFESRNGSSFDYATTTAGSFVQIAGKAGDTVQISVVAVGPNGQLSESSVPSAPFIFQTATAAAVSVTAAPSGAAPVAFTASPTQTELASNEATSVEAKPDPPSTGLSPDPVTATESEVTAKPETLSSSLKETLLLSNVRLPIEPLTPAASAWLQRQVDAELDMAVSLVGTGHADADMVSEIVWQDPTGQLFVTSGADALSAPDLATTLQTRIRLGATERFIALADLEGDAIADWLIEDTETHQVWIIDGVSGHARAAEAPNATDRLLGLGDFDGNGWPELLWRSENDRLVLTHAAPTTADAAASARIDAFAPEATTVLAIADFDGDGRDDILGLSPRDTLEVGLVAVGEGSDPLGLAWIDTGILVQEDQTVLATLDSEDGGGAEAALLSDDIVERVALGF